MTPDLYAQSVGQVVGESFVVQVPQSETGSTLVGLPESRPDNVPHCMGLAATRAQARQLVTHDTCSSTAAS
jgi:ribosomal protein S4